MPARNEELNVGTSPVELTASDVTAIFIYNKGPSAVTIAGAPSAAAPPMVGPTIGPNQALLASVPLSDVFPGVGGVVRVFAQAELGGARLFVSHA